MLTSSAGHHHHYCLDDVDDDDNYSQQQFLSFTSHHSLWHEFFLAAFLGGDFWEAIHSIPFDIVSNELGEAN